MEFNNYHAEVQKTDRDAPPMAEGRVEVADILECKPRYGRHDAHKHHDTMGEIVQSGTDTLKFKYNHDNDFVDSRFKELIPHPEVVGELQTDRLYEVKAVVDPVKYNHIVTIITVNTDCRVLMSIQTNKFGNLEFTSQLRGHGALEINHGHLEQLLDTYPFIRVPDIHTT